MKISQGQKVGITVIRTDRLIFWIFFFSSIDWLIGEKRKEVAHIEPQAMKKRRVIPPPNTAFFQEDDDLSMMDIEISSDYDDMEQDVIDIDQYDYDDQMQVTEYVDDIFYYMRTREVCQYLFSYGLDL